jgi:hypothetical protein
MFSPGYAECCEGTHTAFFFHLQKYGTGTELSYHTPKFPTKDPNYRILARQKSRFTHNYFYIRDEGRSPGFDPRAAIIATPRNLANHCRL